MIENQQVNTFGVQDVELDIVNQSFALAVEKAFNEIIGRKYNAIIYQYRLVGEITKIKNKYPTKIFVNIKIQDCIINSEIPAKMEVIQGEKYFFIGNFKINSLNKNNLSSSLDFVVSHIERIGEGDTSIKRKEIIQRIKGIKISKTQKELIIPEGRLIRIAVLTNRPQKAPDFRRGDE